jgi:hypothetical protein
LLAHFRHQHFLLFLIGHFHRASLVLLSNRLVDALCRLDIKDAESVKQFKRSIRHLKEIFLRFTHRYWFHEISDQAQARALYRMARAALDTERLFTEVRDEIQDMSGYPDSDSLRRQANHHDRFLGMNLLDAADASAREAWVLHRRAAAHDRDHGVLYLEVEAACRSPRSTRRRAFARPE